MLQAALLALMLQDKPDPEAEAVFKTVGPSVVRIITVNRSGSFSRNCGVVVNGGILTTAPLDLLTISLVVLLDTEKGPKRFDATIVAHDKERGLMLLTLPADAPKLPQVPLCSGDVEVGRKIFVVGWPWEAVDTTAWPGTVSSKGPEGKVETIKLDVEADLGGYGAPAFNSAGQVVGLYHGTIENKKSAVTVSALTAFCGEKDRHPPPERKLVPEKDAQKKIDEFERSITAFVTLLGYRYRTNGLVNWHVDLIVKERYSYESVARVLKPHYTELYDEIRNHKIPAGVPEPGMFRAMRENTYKRLENFWELLGNKRSWKDFESRDKSYKKKIGELEGKILNRLVEGP